MSHCLVSVATFPHNLPLVLAIVPQQKEEEEEVIKFVRLSRNQIRQIFKTLCLGYILSIF